MERGVPVRELRSANSTCTHMPPVAHTENTTAKPLVSAVRQKGKKLARSGPCPYFVRKAHHRKGLEGKMKAG